MRPLAALVDRILCRLLGRHAWCQRFDGSGWFCVWCGTRRDIVEVEQ